MTFNDTNGTDGSAETDYQVPLIINDKHVNTSNTFDVISPATGKKLWKSSSASKSDALAALKAAEDALSSWRATKSTVRRDILSRAADIMERRGEEGIKYIVEETGALKSFSEFNLSVAVGMIRDVAGRITGSLSGAVQECSADGTSAIVLKEPFGVVFSISPWNAPLILGSRSFIYAIATGNTAIVKGSELSPRCYAFLHAVFVEAGLPAGVLNVVYSGRDTAAEVTNTLIESPVVKKITFTGSTAIGSIIAATAGKALKPVVMELGGKASAIVCDDADLDHAALQCALGAFLHSGQICMSTERILVHESILKDFEAALGKAIGNLDGITGAKDSPICIQSATVDKNRRLIDSATKSGAHIVHGEINLKEASNTRMRPIVVGGVNDSMDLYHQESFGPSVSLIAVKDDDEAIRIANDTDYGLSGAVFTKDLVRGLNIAKRVESGAVHINSMSVHDEPNLPHGGAKASGFGRFNSTWGMDEFLRPKTITFQGLNL